MGTGRLTCQHEHRSIPVSAVPFLASADLLPDRLPAAWSRDGGALVTTPAAISSALSQSLGEQLPWMTVREAIGSAYRNHVLKLAPGSPAWAGDVTAAQQVKLVAPSATSGTATGSGGTDGGTRPMPPPGAHEAEATLQTNELQDLADVIGKTRKATVNYDLTLRIRIELGGSPPPEVVDEVNTLLEDVSGQLKLNN